MHGDAQRCSSGKEGDLGSGPGIDVARRGGVCAAEDCQHEQEPGDRHDIVCRRRPHVRPEVLLRVEDLTEQRVHPIEEDLGDTPVGEGQGEAVPIGTEGCGEQFDEEGSGQGQQNCDAADCHGAQGDELVDIALPAVSVTFGGADNGGHQHGIDHATGDDHVNERGEPVGDIERIGGRIVDADDGTEQQG